MVRPNAISCQLGRERTQDLLFLGPQVPEESVDARNLRVIGQRAGVVNRFSVGILLSPAADRIVVLQRETERIDADVTIGTSGVSLVDLQSVANRQPAEEFVVGRN